MSLKTISELSKGDIIKFGDYEIVVLKNNNLLKRISININKSEKTISHKEFVNLVSEDYRKVLTHNCAQRLVCGKLDPVPSRMATGSSIATTIDGTHKGAGLVRAQGEVTFLQYYFDNQSRILDWYRKRGLTDKGYNPGEDPNAEIDPSTIDLGEDEDITLENNTTEIKFKENVVTVDNTQSQKFEEI